MLVPAMVMVALLAACSAAQTAAPASQSPSATVMSTTPSPSGSTSATTGAMTAPTGIPATHWAALLSDLAVRGVSTDGLQVVSARAVTWPNGALGCPKAGMAYTQMVIDGYQVVVTAGGTRYDYRFGTTAAPRLCAL